MELGLSLVDAFSSELQKTAIVLDIFKIRETLFHDKMFLKLQFSVYFALSGMIKHLMQACSVVSFHPSHQSVSASMVLLLVFDQNFSNAVFLLFLVLTHFSQFSPMCHFYTPQEQKPKPLLQDLSQFSLRGFFYHI